MVMALHGSVLSEIQVNAFFLHNSIDQYIYIKFINCDLLPFDSINRIIK